MRRSILRGSIRLPPWRQLPFSSKRACRLGKAISAGVAEIPIPSCAPTGNGGLSEFSCTFARRFRPRRGYAGVAFTRAVPLDVYAGLAVALGLRALGRTRAFRPNPAKADPSARARRRLIERIRLADRRMTTPS